LVSALGEDESGREIKQLLNQRGVKLDFLTSNQLPTRIVYVELSKAGERQFVGFSKADPAAFADTKISWPVEAKLLQSGDLVLTGSLELAYQQSRQAIFDALEEIKSSEARLFVDVNLRPVFWKDGQQDFEEIRRLCQEAQFLKLSLEEAQQLFNTTDLAEVAKLNPAVELLLITDGEQGASFWTRSFAGFTPAYLVDSKDSTGAGDGFIAGLLYQLTRAGINIEELLESKTQVEQSVNFAAAVGALVTTGYGPIDPQPNLNEVYQLIEQRQTKSI
jgi:fructokinase